MAHEYELVLAAIQKCIPDKKPDAVSGIYATSWTWAIGPRTEVRLCLSKYGAAYYKLGAVACLSVVEACSFSGRVWRQTWAWFLIYHPYGVDTHAVVTPQDIETRMPLFLRTVCHIAGGSWRRRASAIKARYAALLDAHGERRGRRVELVEPPESRDVIDWLHMREEEY